MAIFKVGAGIQVVQQTVRRAAESGNEPIDVYQACERIYRCAANERMSVAPDSRVPRDAAQLGRLLTIVLARGDRR